MRPLVSAAITQSYMKISTSISRHNFLWLILFWYLLPLIALISYNVIIENGAQDWTTLAIGLFLSMMGTLCLFWGMAKWELSLKLGEETNGSDAKVAKSHISEIDAEEHTMIKRSLDEAQQMQVRLLTEIDALTADLQKAKSETSVLQQNHEATLLQMKEVEKSYGKQLEEQQLHIRDLHEKIAEQKAVMEKKQQHTSLLESKVGDLTYEIKTLLQLAEAHSGSLFETEMQEPLLKESASEPKVEMPSRSTYDSIQKVSCENQEGSHLLKRCIDIAQKITGSQRFGSQLYTFAESPAESFTLDLRRLCDRLRSDIFMTHSTVLVYSPREGQLLFAGNQVRDLTGWSPEKFIQMFNDILQDEGTWKQGINSLSMRSEAKIPLCIKTRSGQTASFQGHLGMIPTGIFRNHIIAVLVSTADVPHPIAL